jgi:tetratricopeptide (TPR) repeat protein
VIDSAPGSAIGSNSVRKLWAVGLAASGVSILSTMVTAGNSNMMMVAGGLLSFGSGVGVNIFSSILQTHLDSKDSSPESVIRNRDIRLLVGEAIRDVILLKRDMSLQVPTLADCAREAWMMEAVAADSHYQKADEEYIVELFKTGEVEFNEKHALDKSTWLRFLETAQCGLHENLEQALLENLAEDLYKLLPTMILGKMKQDFEGKTGAAGKGYASLNLAMIGGIYDKLNELVAQLAEQQAHQTEQSLQTRVQQLEEVSKLSNLLSPTISIQKQRLEQDKSPDLQDLKRVLDFAEKFPDEIRKQLDDVQRAIAAASMRSQGNHDITHKWLKRGFGVVSIIAVLVLGLYWVHSQSPAINQPHETAKAPTGKLAIYVAHLEGDIDNEAFQRNVMKSILKELGQETVTVAPMDFTPRLDRSIPANDLPIEVAKEARQRLADRGGHLLIWGEVIKVGENRTVELHFVTVQNDGAKIRDFKFTTENRVDNITPDIGAALGAVASALALPATEEHGKYIADRMKPLADRLKPLVRSLPVAFSANDKGQVLHAYALLQQKIGEQSGNNARLERAVTAYRRVLEVFPQSRVPLAWAMTQNNLGTVLWTLGERKGDVKLLEQSVTAHREALKEYTQTRVPLDWAMTQNNLGAALRSLGMRKGNVKLLEQSVIAYREALKERTRTRVPLDWAITQENLDRALTSLEKLQEQEVVWYPLNL